MIRTMLWGKVLATCLLTLVATFAFLANAQMAFASSQALASVAWAGPAVNPAALQGKTVLLLTYVTWCPKCNEWSPKLFAEVKQVVADKPVVVLAIATDVPPSEALRYAGGKGLTGINIFHGSDPTINKRLNLQGGLFSYAIIGPDGKLVEQGSAGARFQNTKPAYVPANKVSKLTNFGAFRLLKPDMSPALKERLWLIELGGSRSLAKDAKKLEQGLSAADVETLRGAIAEHAKQELESLESLASSAEVPDRLLALEKAAYLSSQFAKTEAGDRGKELLAELNKDVPLKKEAMAKKQYEVAMQIADADRRAKVFELLAKKYAGTYFGDQAQQAATAISR